MRRQKLIAGMLGSAFSLLAANALADTSVLFGNTLTRSTDGRPVIRYYFDADHTYRIVLSSGATISGTWSDNDGQLCLTASSPEALPLACGPLISGQVGDSWTRTVDGKEMVYTIVAGR